MLEIEDRSGKLPERKLEPIVFPSNEQAEIYPPDCDRWGGRARS